MVSGAITQEDFSALSAVGKLHHGSIPGGRARGTAQLAAIKTRLSELADDVLEGRVDQGNAAVAAQIYNVLLRVHELSRKVLPSRTRF
jgi:hypothetical protein